MAEKVTGSEEGFFRRGSDIYRGGPPEGMLQQLNAPARIIGALVLLLGISICKSPIGLVSVFSLAIMTAVISFLNLWSIYRVMMVPIVLLALPAWLFSSWWYSGFEAGALFFVRTLASVTVVAVALHSVGLRQFGSVLEFFRVPTELRHMWSIMVAQVASFSGLISDMALARKARHVNGGSGSAIRRQVGRQAGVLFSRTWQRGNELGYAMDARAICDARRNTAGNHVRFATGDFVFLIVSCVLSLGLVFL